MGYLKCIDFIGFDTSQQLTLRETVQVVSGFPIGCSGKRACQ